MSGREDDDVDDKVASALSEPEHANTRRKRSLDSFLEEAYTKNSKSDGKHFPPSPYWIMMLALGVSNSSDASEILCLSYILSDSDFGQQFLIEREDDSSSSTSWKASLLAAAVFWGMLVGGLIVGFLGDRYGRRPTLLLGLICNAIAGTLSAFTRNVWQLTILRAIAGIGIGASVPPLFTLVTELSPPTKRGFFVTVCASFWMVGSIYVALMALFVFEKLEMSWRFFTVLCALPSIMGSMLVYRFVPESPRFLALQNRSDQALRVANKIATDKLHYRESPWTIQELLYHYPPESEDVNQSAQRHSPRLRQHKYSLGAAMKAGIQDFLLSTSMLYTPYLIQTTWPLKIIWFSLSFGSYGVYTWINTLFVKIHLENVYYNTLLFALANLPGNLLSAFLMDLIGRKAMLIISSLAAAMSLMVFAWYAQYGDWENETNTVNTGGIVTSACTFQAFVIAAWNTIDCMTSELFPTSVRSTGMGICAASGRVGAMIAQLINAALVQNPSRLLLVGSSFLLVSAVAPCFVHTDISKRPLEDVVESELVEANALGQTYQTYENLVMSDESDEIDDERHPLR